MAALNDIGQVIPYAKKALVVAPTESPTPKKAVRGLQLKDLWPEPKWADIYKDGVDKDVVSHIYGLYHSLAKKPHTKTWTIDGRRVDANLWEIGYTKVINAIRNGCENATTIGEIESFKENFNSKLKKGTEHRYIAYAAGAITPRSIGTVFSGDDFTDRYVHLLPYLDFPASVAPKKIKLFPIKFTDKRRPEGFYVLCKLNKRSYVYERTINNVDNEFCTYEDAAHFLLEHFGAEFTIKQKGDDAPLYVPKKDTLGLIGVDTKGNPTDPSKLLSEFGFRGIQYGNYLPQKERQLFIDNTYHSLALLADFISASRKWIGGGDLAIAFGARGHGFASAHYEVEQRVVNLTRFNGAGSIAHELFHSFEARLMKKFTGESGMLSNYIGDGNKVTSPPDKARYEAFVEIVEACTCDSDYVDNAKAISAQNKSPKYWDKCSELCARAFEAYIQDQLMFLGIKEQWLAYRTLESDYNDNGKHPYPTGFDRTRINEVFSWCLPIIFGR